MAHKSEREQERAEHVLSIESRLNTFLENENKKIKLNEKMYVQFDSEDGETMAEVAARHKVEFEKGDGYYLLSKSEDVSDNKLMVLFRGKDDYIDDATLIRKVLKKGKGKIKVR